MKTKETRQGLIMDLQLFGMTNPDQITNTRSKMIDAVKNKDGEVMVDLLRSDINDMVKDEIKKSNREQRDDMSKKTEVTEIRMFKDVILPGENFKVKSNENRNSKVDLGKLVRGMAGGGWENAEEERNYNRSMNTGSNKVIIPQEISQQIIDFARDKSAILGNVPVIPMEFNELKVLVQKKDAEANFVDEGEIIPSSEAVFGGIDLKGKTLAIFVPISLQLLENADNLASQLEATTSKAIGQALDKAILYGKGAVEGKSTEIKGITEYENINKVSQEKINYDLILKGAKAVKKAKYTPTNVCYNTDLSTELEMEKDSNGQYITPPKSMSNYIISESNNISDNTALIYDSNTMLIGINKDISIEWGTTSDMFQRLQVGLRVHMRVDLVVVNPEGIAIAEAKAK